MRCGVRNPVQCSREGRRRFARLLKGEGQRRFARLLGWTHEGPCRAAGAFVVQRRSGYCGMVATKRVGSVPWCVARSSSSETVKTSWISSDCDDASVTPMRATG